MRVCVITFKPCWQGTDGRWYSDGGFPLQMHAIATLFDEMTMIVTGGIRGGGGIALPPHAKVVPIRIPRGFDTRRKIAVMTNLRYYLTIIARHVRTADVVHVPLPGDIPLLGMVVALLKRKRLIARYGSSWARTRQTSVMNTVTQSMMRFFAGKRNVMFATGEGEAAPGKNISWIFSTAISKKEIAKIPARLNGSLHKPPRIAYIGRLSSEKGVINLIDAIDLMHKEGFHPLPRVDIIGAGPEQDFLKGRVEMLGLREIISFTGQLDRKELSARLRKMDLCVQPSLTEGFSKAWLDAFVHGIPVLATDVGAAGAVVGRRQERGWLVPPGNVRALADALRTVLTHQGRWPELRKRCRCYSESRTLEAWAREIGLACSRQWQIPFEGGKLR